jgi:uncharacterized delta-60 repeat protein
MFLRNLLPALLIALPALLAIPAKAADGDLDTSFSGDGKVWHDWPGTLVQVETTAVLALADGSVVTAGWADNGSNDRDFAIAKFTRDGVLDTNFGNAGTLLVPFNVVIGGDDRAFGVFAVAGNKLLVVGSADVGAMAPYRRPALLRLSTNGQPDTTFGPGGKRVISTQPFGAGASQAFKVARRAPDGKLLIGGYCQSCGNGGPPDFLALRLLPEGDVDTSFGNVGWVIFGRIDSGFWVNEQVNDLAADSTGRVVLAGTSQLNSDPNNVVHPLLVRFTSTGQLDTSFNGTGVHEINLLGSWGASAIAMDLVTDGPIVAINLADPGAATPAALLMRIGSNGTINTAFGEDGLADLTRDQGSRIEALVIREDRRIMAAGWIDPNGASERDFFLARTLANGDVDTSFDGNGAKRVPFDIVVNAYDQGNAVTLSNERAVVAGTVYAHHTNIHFATGVLRLQSSLLFTDGFE